MAYEGTDRRRTDRRAASRDDWDRWREAVNNRLHEGERTMEKLEGALYPRIEKIDEMHEVLTAMKGGFTVLHWIGKAAKPVAYVVAAIAAFIGVKSGLGIK